MLPDDLHENESYDFSCEAEGGVPDPDIFVWKLNDSVLTTCTNWKCRLEISRNDNDATLECQEFQVDNQEGGSDEKRLTVLCMFIQL